MSEISHLLCLRITEYLNTHMIDNVETSDPARASLIQTYRFQDNPMDYPINLFVTRGNPNDVNFIDGRIDLDTMENLGLKVPAGEIGGGHLWWRRGRVIVACYFVDQRYDQVTAGDYANIVLGRTEYYIERTPVSDLIDEFGERAHLIQIYASTFAQSGGPPDQYIWRGEVMWQALTQRPY